MENCLLIGNGLNQCLKDGVPWGNLLQDIARDFHLTSNPNIPLPLEFERLVNQYLQNQPGIGEEVYLETKEKVARKLMDVSLPENAIHNDIKQMKISTVITTNYDLLLENVFDRKFIPEIPKGIARKPAKYLYKSIGSVNGISFYHPHGCGMEAGTICLGYEHYMGIVEKARSQLNAKSKATQEKHIKSILFGEEDFQNTWMEKFYTSNIAILGLGLYQCEVDLWWILTHRASLYYTNYHNIRKKLNNTITYYDVIEDIPAKDEGEQGRLQMLLEQSNKHQLLEGLHVRVCTYKLSEFGTYFESYKKIINDITEDFKGGTKNVNEF